MRKLRLFASLTILCACVLACYAQRKPINHCKLVDLLPSERLCEQVSPSEEHCSLGDIPPMSWGMCVEDRNREFTCEKDGMINHYNDQSKKVWALSCKDCLLLQKQIRILYGIEKETKKDKT